MIKRSVLFSLKCTRKRLAAVLHPDPLGELKRSADPLAVLGGWGPQEGRVREGMGREGKGENEGERGGEGKEGRGRKERKGRKEKGRKSSSPNVH